MKKYIPISFLILALPFFIFFFINFHTQWWPQASWLSLTASVSQTQSTVMEVPASSDLFKYDVFKGANVMGSGQGCSWIPNDTETDIIMQRAKEMHVQILRLSVLAACGSAANPYNCDSCWKIDKIQKFLDKAQANGLKVMITFGDYLKYDGMCSWKRSFVDVAPGAREIVTAFKDHLALFAWDLCNEPLWLLDNISCTSGTLEENKASVIKAVNAMHDLVRSIDNNTLITVGEGKDEYLSTWKNITNFASPHIYPNTSEDFKNRLLYLKSQAGNLPLVIGEFGFYHLTEAENAQNYLKMYQTMAQENVGSMVWVLSTDNTYLGVTALLNSDGSLKPAALAVKEALTPYNGAQFVRQSVPSSMNVGQQYNVSITMKNNGSSVWTKDNNYKLGSQNPQDNWIWREGRVLLSSEESINPGQEKTFNFTVTAPSTPGKYNFQWRMLQENATWFGDYSQNVEIDVQQFNDTTPPAAPSGLMIQ